MKYVLLILILLMPPIAMADDVNLIATYCKKQWPGKKGMQSYCIKNQRNYKDWTGFIQKRVFTDKRSLNKMKVCVKKYRPNYQRAFECYWD